MSCIALGCFRVNWLVLSHVAHAPLRCRGRGAQVGGTHSRYPKPAVASHTCLAKKHANKCIDADLAPTAFLTEGVCVLHTWCARVVNPT